jgi:diguanylate cyclase (GGDEF)-like protein/PAS domain S-box-containing protein
MSYNLEYFFDFAPNPFCILNSKGDFVRVNQAFTEILGWRSDDIHGTPFLNFARMGAYETAQHAIDQLLAGEAAAPIEIYYRCKDASFRFMRWSFSHQDGTLYGNGQDLSELRETYELFRLLIENSPTGMILVDQEGLIQIANQEAARIFGYQQSELIHQNLEMLLPDQNRQAHIAYRETYAQDPQRHPMGFGRDLWGQHRDGHRIELEIGLNPIHTELGSFVLSTIIDLTHRKRSVESMLQFTEQLEESIQELSELAQTDSLTNLKNRRAFTHFFSATLQSGARNRDQLSLLLLDIDDFKSYNDSFGHPAGDHLLVKIAELLRQISRSDDFIARIGGEEFAIILPGTDVDTSLQIAQRYLREFAEMRWPHRQVTASIGAASYYFKSGGYKDLKSLSARLVEQADQALYTAKERGKNQVIHFDLYEN